MPPPRYSMAPTAHHRQSMLPPLSSKPRQYAHLQSQLSQLNANLADLEELLRMTATQCENFKRLGGLMGGFFMAAEKVFEEVNEEADRKREMQMQQQLQQQQQQQQQQDYSADTTEEDTYDEMEEDES